jgi:hypothetical protein
VTVIIKLGKGEPYIVDDEGIVPIKKGAGKGFWEKEKIGSRRR